MLLYFNKILAVALCTDALRWCEWTFEKMLARIVFIVKILIYLGLVLTFYKFIFQILRLM